jgi:hypothetical protein
MARGDPSLLYIVGADRPEQLQITGNSFQLAGSTDLYKLLGQQPYHRLHMTPNYFRQARRPDIDGYDTFLNLITEPEHNSRVLDNLRKLLRGQHGKVVNRPEAVLRSTRDQVARRLAGIDRLVVPKVARLRGGSPQAAARTLDRSGMPYPLIFRESGTHTGKIISLVENASALADTLPSRGEFIATEFVDFRSADGLYRKFRVFFIGGQMIFRHMLVSENWNVHASTRSGYMADRQHLVDEEEARFAQPDGGFPEAVLATLRAIRGRIELDYFGIDFALLANGEVLLFEANATMNFIYFPKTAQFDYLRACIMPATNAFRELLGLAPVPLELGLKALSRPRPD